MTNNNPIGLFDSGIGGTSIWKEINKLLTNEKTIYMKAHLDLEDMLLSEAQQVYAEIEEYLIHQHHVSHVTLQAEVNRCCDKEIFTS